MSIKRRVSKIEAAMHSPGTFPDTALIQHWSERQAAAGIQRNDDSSTPMIETGESWPDYLARCVAGKGISVAELQAQISETLEMERSIIALERFQGIYN